MTYKDDLRIIVLTTITGKAPADVICFHSSVSWSAFKEYVTRMNISYQRITESTAAKILFTNGGVGYGCYTMHGVDNDYEKENEYRQALAKSMKNDIASITGVCSIFDPVELHVDELADLDSTEVRIVV